jgi:outer membrane protein assembly factor BamD
LVLKTGLEKMFLFRAFIIIVLISASLNFYSCSSSERTELTTENPETAYSIAKSKYDKRDYLDAIQDFSLIKLKFSGSGIIDQSIYYLGMSYFMREEFILAAYEFDYLIKNYPTSQLVEDALYRLALSYYRLSPQYDLDQTYSYLAINEFQNYIEFFPDGSHRSEAERRIRELRNKLALKDYTSAQQYYKVSNYRASIIYYDYVLINFPDSDYADDALYGKIVSLIARRQFEEARNEIANFEQRFPNSPLRSRVVALRSQTH